jgi:transposase
VPVTDLCNEVNIPRRTAYRWLAERHTHGEQVLRRRDWRTAKAQLRGTPGSGCPHKIPDAALAKLINSDQASRRQRLSAQQNEAGIHAHKRTLQRSLKIRFSASMFKAATQKEITVPQQMQRVLYTTNKRYRSVEGYWDGFIFTDEAHCALDDFPDEWILRVLGQRNSPDNIVEQRDRGPNSVHFAAWINYYTKAEELTFYNDEYDDVEPIKPPTRPRRRPATETEVQYEERLARWEAEKARQPAVIKPGNFMRANYYTDKILPVYHQLQARSNELRGQLHRNNRYNWYLIEDNDPSHGTCNPRSLPALYCRCKGLERLMHPANSHDLNPIEGIWNIIKERVRRELHNINTIDELKAALQREWKAVTQD